MADGNDFSLGYALGQDNNGGGNNGWGNGFGGEWLWAIILLACLWGGNGFGGFGGGGGGGAYPTEAILQRSLDTQSIIGKLDGINAGICDGFYAQSNALSNLGMNMMQGFHGVDNAVCTLGNAMQGGFNATQVAMMQGFNAAQAQAADCCCKTQTNLMQLGNLVERGFCQTSYNDQANTTAIIQNAHNDTDRVLAKLDAMEMARKDETIANLRTQLAQCGDQSTANYIINQLTGVINPRPVPAYPAASPCGLGNWAPQVLANGCGCNQGCGSCC